MSDTGSASAFDYAKQATLNPHNIVPKLSLSPNTTALGIFSNQLGGVTTKSNSDSSKGSLGDSDFSQSLDASKLNLYNTFGSVFFDKLYQTEADGDPENTQNGQTRYNGIHENIIFSPLTIIANLSLLLESGNVEAPELATLLSAFLFNGKQNNNTPSPDFVNACISALNATYLADISKMPSSAAKDSVVLGHPDIKFFRTVNKIFNWEKECKLDSGFVERLNKKWGCEAERLEEWGAGRLNDFISTETLGMINGVFEEDPELIPGFRHSILMSITAFQGIWSTLLFKVPRSIEVSGSGFGWGNTADSELPESNVEILSGSLFEFRSCGWGDIPTEYYTPFMIATNQTKEEIVEQDPTREDMENIARGFFSHHFPMSVNDNAELGSVDGNAHDNVISGESPQKFYAAIAKVNYRRPDPERDGSLPTDPVSGEPDYPKHATNGDSCFETAVFTPVLGYKIKKNRTEMGKDGYAKKEVIGDSSGEKDFRDCEISPKWIRALTLKLGGLKNGESIEDAFGLCDLSQSVAGESLKSSVGSGPSGESAVSRANRGLFTFPRRESGNFGATEEGYMEGRDRFALLDDKVQFRLPQFEIEDTINLMEKMGGEDGL